MSTRDEINWTAIDDAELLFVFLHTEDDNTIAELHQEILNRPHLVNVIADDNPPITHDDDVPRWLHWWPFCLLWKQRPRRW